MEKMTRLYFEKEETITSHVRGYIEVSMEYMQIYKGLISAYDKINSVCAMKLLVFLMFDMDKHNVVYFNKELIKRFNAQFANKFHERTIRNAITELSSTDIIKKVRNGVYLINALYCWAGKKDERLKYLSNIATLDDLGLVGIDVVEVIEDVDPSIEIPLSNDRVEDVDHKLGDD